MKVYLDYDIRKKAHGEKVSGKAKFILRLEPELRKLGVEFQDKEKGADVALGVSYWRHDRPKIPSVLRVDGVHFIKTPFKQWVNKQIRKGINKSDATIWQTRFAQEQVTKHLKATPRREYVVFNGSDPAWFEVPAAKTQYEHNVLMCALFKNRPQKGLQEMLRVADKYVRKHSNVGFWVAGTTEIKHDEPHIHMLGYLRDEELRRYMKMADVLLYLASYDWCPNSVVEGLTAGLPVIYLKGSGVEELVGDCGIGLEQKKAPKLNFRSQTAPPAFHRSEALSALDDMLADKKRVVRPAVHIQQIAVQYKEVFDAVAG